jgi:hypothetical protein
MDKGLEQEFLLVCPIVCRSSFSESRSSVAKVVIADHYW